MIRTLRKLILIAILFSFSTVMHGQVVQGVEAKIVEDNLVVTYRVGGINTTQLFDVELLSSQDNFQKAITGPNLSGKIGSRIPLDASNEIVIKNPLDVIQGVTNVSFRVRVKMVYYPVVLTSHLAPYKQKMKKDIEISWRGGLRGEQVKFDLYKDDMIIKDDMYAVANSGTAEFKFPKVKKGPNYMIKMELASLPDAVEFPVMQVKPKKSAVGRIIRWSILIGGGAYLANEQGLLGGGGGGGGTTSELPKAPITPN